MVDWVPRTLPYWEDLPSTDTRVDAADLNRFEDGINESVKSDTATRLEVLTQAAYDALGAGRPATTVYLIVG